MTTNQQDGPAPLGPQATLAKSPLADTLPASSTLADRITALRPNQVVDEPAWTHDDLVLIVTHMHHDPDYDVGDIVYAVEKPWKFLDVLAEAKAEIAAQQAAPHPIDSRSYGLVARRHYQHPSGKTITVHPDGTMECRGPDGRVKPTSATAAKLAEGYGRWEEVFPDA